MNAQKSENPLLNILFNILLPVWILNQLSKWSGPKVALIVALGIPLAYSLRHWIIRRKFNFISLIGAVNIAITGGLAVASLSGPWFVLKESAFPLLIGLAVALSAWSSAPFSGTLFLNPQLLKMEMIQQKLGERQNEKQLAQVLRYSTLMLAGSFLFSALLNFVLASRIFVELRTDLSEAERAIELNQQIARMTWTTAAVILLPSMLFAGATLWYLLKQLEKLTGHPVKDILQDS